MADPDLADALQKLHRQLASLELLHGRTEATVQSLRTDVLGLGQELSASLPGAIIKALRGAAVVTGTLSKTNTMGKTESRAQGGVDLWMTGKYKSIGEYSLPDLQPGTQRGFSSPEGLPMGPEGWDVPLEPVPQLKLQRRDFVNDPSHIFRSGKSFLVSAQHSTVLGHRSSRMMQRMNLLPIHPSSTGRTIFDLACIVCLMYDAIMVPLMLAWNFPLCGPLLVISLAMLGFWVGDMLLNFVTEFYDHENDRWVRSLRAIAAHYLRTAFALDMFLILIDLGSFVLELSTSDESDMRVKATIARLGRLGKLSRAMRFVMLLRTGRFGRLRARVVNDASCIISAQQVHLATVVLQTVCVIAWLNHIGCCLWYVVTFHSRAAGGSWYSQLILREGSEEEMGFVELYTTGYYWSVSTMFSCGSYMSPGNWLECVFSLLFIIFGVLFTNFLVSTLAATLIQLGSADMESNERIRQLQQFLHQHRIPGTLAARVHHQAEERERAAKEARLPCSKVAALNTISASLRHELLHTTFRSLLMTNHLLRALDALDDQFLVHLNAQALTVESHPPGQAIFVCEQSVNHASFVSWGSLEYARCGYHKQQVARGACICEMALFVHWSAHGMLEVITPSELVHLSAQGFSDVLRDITHEETSRIVRRYVRSLCSIIEREHPDGLSDLSTGIDHDIVVAQLPRESRELLSRPHMDTLQGSWATILARKKGVDDLFMEVNNGQTHLSRDKGAQGKIFRVVQVVVLRLARSDGAILVEVGHLDSNDTLNASMVLPATKTRAEETQDEAVRRIVNRIPSFKSVELRAGPLCIERKPSNSYGVETKYIRREFEGEVAELTTAVAEERVLLSESDWGMDTDDTEVSDAIPIISGVNIRRADLFAITQNLRPPGEMNTSTRAETPGTVNTAHTDSCGLGGQCTPRRSRNREVVYYAWMREIDYDLIRKDFDREKLSSAMCDIHEAAMVEVAAAGNTRPSILKL